MRFGHGQRQGDGFIAREHLSFAPQRAEGGFTDGGTQFGDRSIGRLELGRVCWLSR